MLPNFIRTHFQGHISLLPLLRIHSARLCQYHLHRHPKHRNPDRREPSLRRILSVRLSESLQNRVHYPHDVRSLCLESNSDCHGVPILPAWVKTSHSENQWGLVQRSTATCTSHQKSSLGCWQMSRNATKTVTRMLTKRQSTLVSWSLSTLSPCSKSLCFTSPLVWFKREKMESWGRTKCCSCKLWSKMP